MCVCCVCVCVCVCVCAAHLCVCVSLSVHCRVHCLSTGGGHGASAIAPEGACESGWGLDAGIAT